MEPYFILGPPPHLQATSPELQGRTDRSPGDDETQVHSRLTRVLPRAPGALPVIAHERTHVEGHKEMRPQDRPLTGNRTADVISENTWSAPRRSRPQAAAAHGSSRARRETHTDSRSPPRLPSPPRASAALPHTPPCAWWPSLSSVTLGSPPAWTCRRTSCS